MKDFISLLVLHWMSGLVLLALHSCATPALPSRIEPKPAARTASPSIGKLPKPLASTGSFSDEWAPDIRDAKLINGVCLHHLKHKLKWPQSSQELIRYIEEADLKTKIDPSLLRKSRVVITRPDEDSIRIHYPKFRFRKDYPPAPATWDFRKGRAGNAERVN